MTTDYPGIDYGCGQTNVDKQTGIRYGVISPNELGDAWYEQSEAYYGKPHCPNCGNEADEPGEFGETFADGRPEDYSHEEHECDDYVCVHCKHFFGSESAFGDEPVSHFVDADGYRAECGDGDIFISKSPYYTHAQFCSPCAPGAGYLMNHCPEGPKTYCFGHEWFEEGAPYPVYRVDTGELVDKPK